MGNEESHRSAPRLPNPPIHATSTSYVPPSSGAHQDPHSRRQTQTNMQAQPNPGGWVVPPPQNKVYPDLPPTHPIEQTKHAQATMQQIPSAPPPMFYPQPAANAFFPQPAIGGSSVMAPSGAGFLPAHPNSNDIWSKGHQGIPPNAFRAGHDTDRTVIHICRASHEGDLLPGKLLPNHRHAYVPYCGKEVPVDAYEILIGNQYKWMPSGNGNVPAAAVVGGHTKSGEKLFIGRAAHNHSLTPGKIHPSHGCLYIPYGGEELSYKEYEVLVHSNF